MFKRILSSILLAATILSGCAKQEDLTALEEKVSGIEKRVADLETKCNQMNTNISSLQTIVAALQEADFITGINPIKEGDQTIGYMISFLKNGSINIFHGEKGEDGLSPIISIAQDLDGLYYWTLNGEWLVDGNGAKIPVRGQDGATGSQGPSGITPKLKIDADKWFISYNEGQTWVELGNAVPDSLFMTIITENDYVHFTLRDGREFSLPCFVPVDITFGIQDNDALISSGQVILIPYTLSGCEK